MLATSHKDFYTIPKFMKKHTKTNLQNKKYNFICKVAKNAESIIQSTTTLTGKALFICPMCRHIFKGIKFNAGEK